MRSPYEPEKIEVIEKDGRPLSVWVRKRRVQVKEVLNMWRIDEEWWRKPISRLYFLMELENNSRVTLFKDLVGGVWYRQNWVQ